MSDWTNPASGNWSNAANWTGAVPDAVGAVANFIVPNPGNATALITFFQNADFTVGTLNVTTASDQGWRFLGEAGVTLATLRFQGAGGGPAFLNVDTNNSSRQSSISSANGLRVVLGSDLIVTTIDADAFFLIEAPITSTRDIYKFGDGTLRISGSNASMTGDYHLNGGRTEITSANAMSGVGVIKLNNDAALAATATFTLAENIEIGSGDATGNIGVEATRTLTLTGQLELRGSAFNAVKIGNATDTGTIILSGTSLITDVLGGGFEIAGGTLRFGNAGAAANYFSSLSAAGRLEVNSGAILDTGGFATAIDNLDMDGGTIQSTGGALDLTIELSILGVQAGAIVGTAQADRLVFNLAAGGSINLSTVSFTSWNNAADTITLNGSGVDDSIVGSTQNDVINGGAGNDFLQGFGGVDTIRGGTGDDVYSIADTASTLIENAGEGTDEIVISSGGPPGFTLATNFENLTFSDSAQHVGTGNSAVNILTGGSGVDQLSGLGGDDTLRGNNGDDTLNGGSGADTMEGGFGDDFFFVDNVGDIVTELAGQGNDRVFAALTYVLAAGTEIEKLTTTDNFGTAAINLTGNALAQSIFGNEGANSLTGGGGLDTLAGLGGDDFYFVDGDDMVYESAGAGNDRIFASASFTLIAGSEVEKLTTTNNFGTAAINLTGNAFAQAIFGNDGVNSLTGGGGLDTLAGLGGDDFYFVDGDDMVYESVGGGNDRIFASASHVLIAGSHVEKLTTADNSATTVINLTGNELAQTIFGNAGANILNGGLGADDLNGLGGADFFAFTTALGGGNVDRINDLISGTDRIVLDDAVFTGLSTGALNANAFRIGAAAQDADDRIVYNQATGAIFFDADGNGAGSAIQFATLNAGQALAASDFTVI